MEKNMYMEAYEIGKKYKSPFTHYVRYMSILIIKTKLDSWIMWRLIVF